MGIMMMNGVVLSQVIGVFLFLGGGVNGFVTPQQQRPTPYAFSRQATPMEIATKSDFENMRSFEQRLAAIEDIAPDILLEFYEPHLNSFSVKPGSVSRLSITSTCYSLLAIDAARDQGVYDSMIAADTLEEQPVPIDRLLRELLNAEWRDDDLFQVPLLLYTVLKLDRNRELLGSSMDEQLANRIRRLLSAVLSARPQRRYGPKQVYSDYIVYWCSRVYSILQTSSETPTAASPWLADEQVSSTEIGLQLGGLSHNALPEGASNQVSLALARSAEVSFNELTRQLAYRSANDNTLFDVIRLGYSLLTYLQSTNGLVGTAGRELVPGQGPSPGTTAAPLNRRLVTAALAAFFDEQQPDGLWDKGQPIYKSFRRQGRNVGNAFVFAIDTVASLLEQLPAEDFRPHLGALQKTLEWVEGHQQIEVIVDYCDVDTGQCYGKPLRGWSSPHLSPDSGPQAWSTAQVLTCVSRIRTVIKQLMHNDVLQEFRGVALSAKGKRDMGWDRLLDTDLGDPSSPDVRTIKDVIEERVISPFAVSASSPSFGAAYSAILFGPPGTAKTTVCEALAQKMGWDFLVIDTAAFLADGLTNVANRIRYVFERLQALNECVILFDEIEEFCLDRENPGIGMQSRMLTTAMLTAINDLRRAKRSVFFLATNRLRAFDSAITRPGRFDMQLFVGTPNLNSRVLQFRQKLAAVSVKEETAKADAEHAYHSFLESVWTEDAMFMNYLEGMQFAAACAKIVAQGGELTEQEMSLILKQQANVMTVRGPVRDEYTESMNLSRL